MTRVTIKPLPGCIVRHPISKLPLRAEGEEVTLTTFWSRRLRAGDVVKVTAVKTTQAKKKSVSADND